MSENTYNVYKPQNGVPIKAWTKGVPVEEAAQKQLLNVAQLPFIFKWVAAMPDVHWGIGATVGSVIPTKGAIIPAGCGRGYRLRHDGGEDQPERRAPAGQSAWLAYSDRKGCPARPHRQRRQERPRRVARTPAPHAGSLGDACSELTRRSWRSIPS